MLIGGMEVVSAVGQFINLRRFSMASPAIINDELLSNIPRLELRDLSITGNKLLPTGNGLLDLVQRLPQLDKLSLYPVGCFDNARIELLESTYSQVCQIYRNRNQKLVIYNFDIRCYQENRMKRREPFAGDDRQKFVQFIAVDLLYHDSQNVFWI